MPWPGAAIFECIRFDIGFAIAFDVSFVFVFFFVSALVLVFVIVLVLVAVVVSAGQSQLGFKGQSKNILEVNPVYHAWGAPSCHGVPWDDPEAIPAAPGLTPGSPRAPLGPLGPKGKKYILEVNPVYHAWGAPWCHEVPRGGPGSLGDPGRTQVDPGEPQGSPGSFRGAPG